MKAPKKTHLGDGIYAADHGTHIRLISKQKSGKGGVELNAETLDKLLSYLEKTCGTVITVEKAEGRE